MQNGQFGIYVHWPFCASKCPYCDFNSHVSNTIDHAAWRKAYEAEIAYYAAMTPDRTVTSIFFGGGTPSLMEPETAATVISSIQKHWRISNDCEITLEANPTSVEIGKFRDFRQAGVNRVSIGVQSLRDDQLKFLGRQHDAAQARRAIEDARSIFERYSFDLIYARPGQAVRDWEDELRAAIDLAGDHLSVYQLTIEKGTPFYIQHERGDFKIPEEQIAADLYEATQDTLGAAGMPAYEVSNHARAGQESQHNLTYWRYTDYAGIGPGAHGRVSVDGQKFATRGHRAPDVWLSQALGAQGHGAHPFESLSPRDRFVECLMMGMRLLEGVPLARLEEEGAAPFAELVSMQKVKALQGEGLLHVTDEDIRPSVEGLQRLNAVLSYLL